MTVALRVERVDPYRRSARLRFPFGFGNAVVDRLDIAYLRLHARSADGRAVTGVSASILAPLWFDKDPERSIGNKTAALLTSIDRARTRAVAAAVGDVASLFSAMRSGDAAPSDDLTRGFGPALVGHAIVDAACRALNLPLHAALRADRLGFGPRVARALPAQPAASVAVRHTVGLQDSLGGVAVGEGLCDGQPATLAAVLAEHRPRFLKIKVEGGSAAEASLARLREIAALLDSAPVDPELTLDANESFADMESFAEFVEKLRTDTALRNLWRRTLWLEQPVHRDTALTPAVAGPLGRIAQHKPVVIDESDAGTGALEQALRLGYAGTSIKSCKGLDRALAHLVAAKDRPILLTAEDLTCPAIVPLHQDLAVAAAAGFVHVERNGHHYLRGLDHLTEREQHRATADYPTLYERAGDRTGLRITAGQIALDDVNRAPFGVVSEPDWAALDPLSLSGS